MENAAEDVVAVVTHGTVLALFLAKHNRELKGFDVWRRMGLPSFVVIEVPGYRVSEMVERE